MENVALGNETKQIWNPRQEWVYSNQPVHTPLVSLATFTPPSGA